MAVVHASQVNIPWKVVYWIYLLVIIMTNSTGTQMTCEFQLCELCLLHCTLLPALCANCAWQLCLLCLAAMAATWVVQLYFVDWMACSTTMATRHCRVPKITTSKCKTARNILISIYDWLRYYIPDCANMVCVSLSDAAEYQQSWHAIHTFVSELLYFRISVCVNATCMSWFPNHLFLTCMQHVEHIAGYSR